jgi:signal peptidase I
MARILGAGWERLRTAASTLNPRSRWIVVAVHGDSMSPTFHHGERVLARRLLGRELRRGDVIVFKTDFTIELWAKGLGPALRLKRIVAVSGDPVPSWLVELGSDRAVPDRCVVVSGDNEVSQDSRQLGYIKVEDVVAVVLRRIARARTT